MMRKMNNSKLLILMLLLGLVMTLVVPTTWAQDEGEGETTEEVAEDSHGEEGADAAEESGGSPLDALGINQGFLIAQIINFLIIFGFLTLILWRPVVRMLDNRNEKIAQGLEDASVAAKARMNAEQEAEKVLADARTEAARILDEARNRGEELAQTIKGEADGEASKILESAREDAAQARDVELAGLRDQVVNISTALASRVIGENLDAGKQQALVNDFFSSIPAEAQGLSGDVEVISAMPLNDDEQARARDQIGGDVTFRVDPSILGGLVVLSGDKVIDGSVRSTMGDLVGRLN